MLKLENIPPEQMPEVVRIASELYEQDKVQDAEAEQRQATVDAAEEIGLPEAYLQRAAAELHARRVEAIAQRQQRRRVLAAAGVGTVLMLGVYTLFRTKAPAPAPPVAQAITTPSPLSIPFRPTAWQLNTNAGTVAKTEFVKERAVLSVQRFAPDAQNRYFANLNTYDSVKNLSGYRTVTFRVQGKLPQVRLYLENGNERWRSPMVPVSVQERPVQLPLEQFDYQVRTDRQATWEKSAFRPPDNVQNLSFKTGWFVNGVRDSGDVILGDLKFE